MTDVEYAVRKSVSNFSEISESAEKELTRLYKSDGNQKYVTELHNEKKQAIATNLLSELSNLENSLRTIEQELESERIKKESADELSLLNPTELTKANAKATFVREETESMDMTTLAARLNAVALENSQHLTFLYSKYAKTAIEKQSKAYRDYKSNPYSGKEKVSNKGLMEAKKALESLNDTKPNYKKDLETIAEQKYLLFKTLNEAKKLVNNLGLGETELETSNKTKRQLTSQFIRENF